MEHASWTRRPYTSDPRGPLFADSTSPTQEYSSKDAVASSGNDQLATHGCGERQDHVRARPESSQHTNSAASRTSLITPTFTHDNAVDRFKEREVALHSQSQGAQHGEDGHRRCTPRGFTPTHARYKQSTTRAERLHLYDRSSKAHGIKWAPVTCRTMPSQTAQQQPVCMYLQEPETVQSAHEMLASQLGQRELRNTYAAGKDRVPTRAHCLINDLPILTDTDYVLAIPGQKRWMRAEVAAAQLPTLQSIRAEHYLLTGIPNTYTDKVDSYGFSSPATLKLYTQSTGADSAELLASLKAVIPTPLDSIQFRELTKDVPQGSQHFLLKGEAAQLHTLFQHTILTLTLQGAPCTAVVLKPQLRTTATEHQSVRAAFVCPDRPTNARGVVCALREIVLLAESMEGSTSLSPLSALLDPTSIRVLPPRSVDDPDGGTIAFFSPSHSCAPGLLAGLKLRVTQTQTVIHFSPDQRKKGGMTARQAARPYESAAVRLVADGSTRTSAVNTLIHELLQKGINFHPRAAEPYQVADGPWAEQQSYTEDGSDWRKLRPTTNERGTTHTPYRPLDSRTVTLDLYLADYMNLRAFLHECHLDPEGKGHAQICIGARRATVMRHPNSHLGDPKEPLTFNVTRHLATASKNDHHYQEAKQATGGTGQADPALLQKVDMLLNKADETAKHTAQLTEINKTAQAQHVTLQHAVQVVSQVDKNVTDTREHLYTGIAECGANISKAVTHMAGKISEHQRTAAKAHGEYASKSSQSLPPAGRP
jgi:hypothetical protein